MRHQKIKNQPVRVSDDATTYEEWMNNERNHVTGGGNGGSGVSNKPQEFAQANPDSITEGEGYYAVDENTKEIQERVRKMMELAKQVLTMRQYNAFILVDIKELTMREAAKVMQCNFQRVSQLVTTAHEKLRKVYDTRTV